MQTLATYAAAEVGVEPGWILVWVEGSLEGLKRDLDFWEGLRECFGDWLGEIHCVYCGVL